MGSGRFGVSLSDSRMRLISCVFMNGSVYKNVMVRGVNGIASRWQLASVGQNADLVPFAHDIIFLSITKGVVGLGGGREVWKFIIYKLGFVGTEKNWFNFPEKKWVVWPKKNTIFFPAIKKESYFFQFLKRIRVLNFYKEKMQQLFFSFTA